MRRKLVFSVACLLVVGLVAAVLMTAKQPLRGDQVMVLNQDEATGEFGLYGCEELSWFGSIDIDGTTYGMALYPLPGRITGNRILHYEEGWKVWTGAFTLTEDSGSYSLDSCEPGEVVLSGTDFGVGSFIGTKFRSNGIVEEAFYPFAEWLGRRVHQDGVLGPIDFGPLESAFGVLRRPPAQLSNNHWSVV